MVTEIQLRLPRRIYRQQLNRTLGQVGAECGVAPDVSLGINAYLQNTFTHEHFPFRDVVGFMVDLSRATAGTNFYKSRSFNYLSQSENVAEVLTQAAENARLMISIFGMDLFSRLTPFSDKRKTFFKALVPDSDFYLTAKGGAGAGTFCVDLALGVERGQGFNRNSWEIWRSGFDTEVLPNGRLAMRIIRTGTGVRHHPEKSEKFEEFKHTFKISPARALTFLILELARTLHLEQVTALTTEGAKTLSTLPSNSAYDYTDLFEGLGFRRVQEDGLWLVSKQSAIPRRREITGLARLHEALQNLRDEKGQSFAF